MNEPIKQSINQSMITLAVDNLALVDLVTHNLCKISQSAFHNRPEFFLRGLGVLKIDISSTHVHKSSGVWSRCLLDTIPLSM